MRKAVAIPYVIALILGIVVIALIGYWLVSQGGKTTGTGNTVECDALCVIWRNSGFNIKPSGIDKCPQFPATGGASVCATKLGCDFNTKSDAQCPAGSTDYGSTSVSNGYKVCCKGG